MLRNKTIRASPEAYKYQEISNYLYKLFENSCDVVHLLCEKGYSAEYGVRAIKRAINKYIVDGLADALTHGDISIHKPILVSGQVNRIVFANG